MTRHRLHQRLRRLEEATGADPHDPRLAITQQTAAIISDPVALRLARRLHNLGPTHDAPQRLALADQLAQRLHHQPEATP